MIMKNKIMKKIPEGYKQTEIGVIPEDWKVNKLANVASLKARIGWQGLTTAEYKDFGEYYLITGTDFKNGFIDWENCHYVEKARYSQDKNIQIKEHDVLVTKDGTIGKVALINRIIKPATLNSGVFVIRPFKNEFFPEYFYYLLLSKVFFKFLVQLSAGSTINHLYQKDFVNFSFQVPSNITEQTAIATVLSDTDALVEHLEKLIAKKKGIKKGAMQQLLTGKKRLPEFSGEWKVKSFGEVLSRINAKEYQIQTSDYQETGKYPVVDQGKDLVVGYSDREGKSVQCPKGGVVVFGDHTCIVKFVNFDFVVGADGTQILVAKSGHCTRFYAFQLAYRGIATTGYNRHFKFLKERTFLSPDPEEQAAIVSILSDMDAEIESLEQKRDKYIMLKQGMTQQLLTGRIRIYANN